MPSFFSVPKTHNKRKRDTTAEAPKKRIATAKPGNRAASSATRDRKHPSRRSKGKHGNEQNNSDDEGEDFDDDDSDIESTNSAIENVSDSDGDDGENETAAEKRLRLAEQYLENVKQDVHEDYGFDAAEIDREIIASRLQEDVAESKGKVYKQLASGLDFSQATHALFKSNTQTVTAVAAHAGYAYIATKDLMLQKWRLQDLPKDQYQQRPESGGDATTTTGEGKNKKMKKSKKKSKSKKPPAPPRKQPERVRIYRGNRHMAKNKTYKGHTAEILCVAVSPDGQFVVTGGADHKIIVYTSETLKPIRVFTHHRSGVTGLVFRRGTNQMYSCSRDRVVKVWSLDELAFVSSLFGHEEAVVDIDALAQERCITVGSRDRTARYWKVVDEKQLVFRGGARDRKPVAGLDARSQAQEGSIDRVAMLDDELFVTGGDSGTLTLWSVQKKNPLFAIPRAHGVEDSLRADEASAEANPDLARIIPPPQPRWITALKTVPYSDVVITGSWDGFVRVWKLSEDKRRLEAVGPLGEGPRTAAATTALLPEPAKTNGAKADAEANSEANGDGMNVESTFEGLSSKEPTPAPATTTTAATTPAPITPAGISTPPPFQPGFEVKGVINDLSVFERGNRGKDGLCVVAAVGKEHRFGRWMKDITGAKNGGCVFEVSRVASSTSRINDDSTAAADADAGVVNGEGKDTRKA